MEASALQAPVGLARRRSTIGLAVLRLRSDEQLVALLRSGHDEAFEVIHDRYHARLFAYMRQMLPLRQDVEDALQEVFERAYASLCAAGDRELLLRPWLYRIAHNRCVDHLRRPLPPPPEMMLQLGPAACDPILETDRREALRRLMVDVRRLPEQQRSALLMRELGGISYAEVAQALGVTIPAVKSLLVRARISLVQSVEARDAACEDIRAQLVEAYEGRVRPGAMARRHLRDCSGCRDFRGGLRGVRRQLLAISPSLGPLALIARLLGGSSAPGGGAAAACGGSAGVAGTGALGSGGLLASAGVVATGVGHVATIIAATVVTAGSAVELQGTLSAAHHHHRHPAPAVVHRYAAPAPTAPAAATASASVRVAQGAATPPSPGGAATATAATAAPPSRARATAAGAPSAHLTAAAVASDGLAPIPDITSPVSTDPSSAGAATSSDTGATAPGDPSAGNSSGSSTGATTVSSTGSSTSTSTGSTTPTPGTTGGPVPPPAGTGASGTGTSSSTPTGSGPGSGVTTSTSPQASGAQGGSSVS